MHPTQTRASYSIVLATAWLVLVWLSSTAAYADPGKIEKLVRRAATRACVDTELRAEDLIRWLDIKARGERSDISVRGRSIGWRTQLELSGDGSLVVERIAPRRRLNGVRVQWNNDKQLPVLLLAMGADCKHRVARRIRYDRDDKPAEVLHLDQQLAPTGTSELLNPEVPPGENPEGMPIAIVDSGVNYLLPEISTRLARDDQNRILGIDFWDNDARPFDYHPVPSLFFPQRHGTRTASLLLREAPSATLVPYRYPRSDMARMADLVKHVADHGIRIVALPLGGNQAEPWQSFGDAVKNHPELLFVVSAGNNGRDIDQAPVYPAALALPNMVVVTSADDHIRPAERTNWGANSVHLMVPAEHQKVLSFQGETIEASGSSYAVARIAALAARLWEQNPEWTVTDLKTELFGRAIVVPGEPFVSVGYLADPLTDLDEPISANAVKSITLAEGSGRKGARLQIELVLLEGSGWEPDTARDILLTAVDILAQCDIQLISANLHRLTVPDRLLDFDVATAKTLLDQTEIRRPAVFLVRDTHRRPAFDGEAFGRANSKTRPWLRDTVWLTVATDQPALALSHELFHVIANSGQHVSEEGNLMTERTKVGSTELTPAQCERARKTGLAHGFLTTIR